LRAISGDRAKFLFDLLSFRRQCAFGQAKQKAMKMAETRQLTRPDARKIGTRRGFDVFAENPSRPTLVSLRSKVIPLETNSDALIVIDEGTGEVLGQGSLGLIKRDRVDRARFIKVYEAGMKQFFQLSSSAASVLGVVYREVMENPNTDRVELNMFKVQRCGLKISDRTYQRSVRELLDKKFLYMSPSEGVYFINVNYVYNGDRFYTATVTDLDEPGRYHHQPLLIQQRVKEDQDGNG
jgi:hypothetical protein